MSGAAHVITESKSGLSLVPAGGRRSRTSNAFYVEMQEWEVYQRQAAAPASAWYVRGGPSPE